jgi:1-acyl-sn-glycerol-3-phosphate acyltransferase
MARRATRPATVLGILAAARAVLATVSSYLLAFPLTFVGMCLGIVVALLGMRAFLRAGIAVWARMPFWLVGRRLHLRGDEHIECSGRYLVVANHTSIYDVPALLAVVPGMAFMGREYLERIPVVGRFLRSIRFIPVDAVSVRKSATALTEAVARARDGLSVGMFPEGTRTPDGEVQRLKRGFARVLRDGGLDLLPVRIDGTWTLKPKGCWYMNPRERIEVTVRRPIAHGRIAHLPDHEIVEQVRRGISKNGEQPA